MNYYRFKLRTSRKNKNGLYDLNMEICKKGFPRKYLSLGLEGDKNFWDEEQERFVVQKGLRTEKAKLENELRKKQNAAIAQFEKKAEDAIRYFDDNNINWTPNQLKEKIIFMPTQGLFFDYITNHIKNLRDTKRFGTANDYQSTLHMLKLFDSKIMQKYFSEIDVKYLNQFNLFLEKRGNKGNTRKNTIKPIRAIYNKAIKDGEAERVNYPFGNDGFSISSLEESTQKRYLPNSYLNAIKEKKVQRKVEEYARELFLFLYYCHGIPFRDMALLTKKNIFRKENGYYIVYKRVKTTHNKTSKYFSIRITEEIKNCINWLNNYKKPINNYLLPVITVDYEGEKLYNHIKYQNKAFNKYLKDLAKTLKIETNLTSYVSRHSVAMKLQNSNVNRETISQLLGHSDLKTTNTYLDSLDTTVIDKASEVL